MTLKKTISSGIFYTAITRYSGIVISIVIGAILARLLSPTEFGVIALVMVFIYFFNILSEAGIGPAVVQNKDLSTEDIQSIFSFSIIFGIILALLFFFSAPLISAFYNNNELISITRLLSITIFFSALRIVPNALLTKQLKFKQMGIIMIIVQLFSGLIAVFFAYKGYSYYALVYKSIFDAVLIFIIFYSFSEIKVAFIMKKEALLKIMRFSSFQFFFNFINYFSRNMDNLLIGKFINPAALGFYDKSYQLMMMPVQNLTHVITPVLHPILSAFQDEPHRIFKEYLIVVKILATIGFPLSVFLYFAAPEIITILYGDQWKQSIPVFQILALTIGIQMVFSSSGAIFQAVNRTDLLFYSGAMSAFFMVSGICYGVFVRKNVEAVGYGLIIAFIINFFQGFYMLIKVALKSSLIEFLRVFLIPILISLVLFAILSLTTDIKTKNLFLNLVIKSFLSLTVLFLFLMFDDDFNNFKYRLFKKNI